MLTFGHGGDWDPPAGQYTITAKKASDASRTDTASVAIVQVSSVSVESGASQTHVTGSKNWAAIKATPGDVVIKATINPPIAEGSIPADLITWTGGTAVSGQLLHRKVSKTTSAKTNVKATCGTSEAEANIWVIWASITIQTSGDKPSAANTLFFALNNPKCGPTTSSQVGYGNICGIVTLTPAGVGEIISSGWDIKREQQHLIITITNSTPTEKSRDTSWTDDDAHNQDEILQPINGKLYVIDNPSICYEYPGVDIIIVMRNFREWLAWNGKKCSDYSPWYFRGLFDAVSGGIIPQVGVGRIDFPAAPKQ